MAKYGVFSTQGGMPKQQYEGDYMMQDKQFVQIFKEHPDAADELVAAIHLDKGQSVMKIVE
ncbi:MAG TPA: hypothetical protein VG488_01090 [Candidatus Angelobacter sp.]|jgi:hypothetical protein|nr:hypothetical protein [Candidatus Angelobacter sp.]